MHQKLSQSLGNLSRDSGVLVMAKPGSHSRSASNASSNYTTASNYNEASSPSKCKFNLKVLSIFLGLVLAILSLLGYAYLPIIVRGILQTFINIKPNEEFYNFWIKSSEPTEVGIYFFHVENPWAVENGLENLRVREMGTYMFKQNYIREIANFSDDMSIVNFTERRYFVFDAEKTTGSLDDNITVVNVPYAALSSLVPRYVDDFPSVPLFSSFGIFTHFSYRSINHFLAQHNQHLFINTTVRELLYGYKLDILDTAESYSSMFAKFGFDIMPNKLFPNNSFGILNGRNGTPDGPYEMYTGLAGSHDKFSNFKTWNGLEKLDVWNGDSCNAINGTDGTMWPAGVNTKDRLYFFIPDVCRSLYVTFQEESQYKGIPTYIFSAPDSLLAGKRTNPENECFCLEENEELAEERCTLDGIFDMAGCQNGIPLIVSLPHFLGADERITRDIEGLRPNSAKHRPELHVEPTMGTVIHGDSRLQMSIRVPHNENLRGFDKIKKDLYIPIFWGYKKLGMSDEMAQELKFRLFYPVKIVKCVFVFLLIGGIGCILFGLIKMIIAHRKTVLTQILNKDYESGGQAIMSYKNRYETERMMPRVESETSDLGDTKSETGSFANTPRSSTCDLQLELSSLVKSAETDI